MKAKRAFSDLMEKLDLQHRQLRLLQSEKERVERQVRSIDENRAATLQITNKTHLDMLDITKYEERLAALYREFGKGTVYHDTK